MLKLLTLLTTLGAFVIGSAVNAFADSRELMLAYAFTAELTEKLKTPALHGDVFDSLHPAIARSIDKEMAMKRIAASVTARTLNRLASEISIKVESKALKIDDRELLPKEPGDRRLPASFYQVFIRWTDKAKEGNGADVKTLASTTAVVAIDPTSGKTYLIHLSDIGTFSDLLTLHLLRSALDCNFLGK